MDNFNNNNNENKEVFNDNIENTNINKSAILVLIVTFLAICFCASYFVTDYIVKSKREASEEEDETGRTVISQSNKYINDSVTVTLKTGDKVDSEQTLAAIKHSNNVAKDITREELSNLMKKSGYELVEMTEASLLFIRPKDYKEVPLVEVDKYFIGERDGFLAIYKSDKNGNLSITGEEDVYRQSKKVSDLPQIDQEKIKNLEFKYDSREEAIENLTEFIS